MSRRNPAGQPLQLVDGTRSARGSALWALERADRTQRDALAERLKMAGKAAQAHAQKN